MAKKAKIFTAVAIMALVIGMGAVQAQAQTLPTLATVNVIKQVVGSTLPPSSFTLQISGTAFSTTTFQGSALTPLFLTATGTYAITEVNVPANFAVSYSAGCTGTALLNSTSTCIVTNTFTGTSTTTPPPPPPPPPPAGIPNTGAGNPLIPVAIALVLLSGTGLVLARKYS